MTFGPAVKQFGGRIVVKTADLGVKEKGQGASGLLTVIEFKSLKDAKAFYASPAYKVTKDMRTCSSKCDLVIAEGTAPATRGAGCGIIIARIKVANRGRAQRFQDRLEPLVAASKKRGGRILAKCLDPNVMECEQGAEGALLIIEFASVSKANLFYNSDEYQLFKKEGLECTTVDLSVAKAITPP